MPNSYTSWVLKEKRHVGNVINNCYHQLSTILKYNVKHFKIILSMLFSKYHFFVQVLVNHYPVSHLINGKSDLRHQGATQAHGLASYYMEPPSNFSYRNSDMDPLRLSCLSIPLLHYRLSDCWAAASMIMVDTADLTLGMYWLWCPCIRQAWCSLELACI